MYVCPPCRVGEMAQQGKHLLGTPDNLGLVPGTYVEVGGQDSSTKCSLLWKSHWSQGSSGALNCVIAPSSLNL